MKVNIHFSGPRQRDVIIFFIVAFIIATVLLILYFVTSKRPDGYIEIKGIITSITEEYDVATESYDHHVFVKYTYNGVEYINETDGYVASMKVGQTITLFMNPNNPNKITLNGTQLMGNALLIASICTYGAGALVPGVFFITKLIKNHKKQIIQQTQTEEEQNKRFQ